VEVNLPEVSIVVLNWNGLVDTLACLDSLKQLDYPSFQVIVVDNGSDDGSPEVIRSGYPEVRVIETDENLGYVGGNNLGLDYACSRNSAYVLLLNNDTVVAPDFLRKMVEFAEADSEIGVVGPTIYYAQPANMIWAAGGKLDRRTGMPMLDGMDEIDSGQYGEGPRQVDFVTGCALLVKTSVVKEVGKLDSRFFAYFEENEWCMRVNRAGYKIYHLPGAKIWHKISPDHREHSPQVYYYMTRNRLLFTRLANLGVSSWLSITWEYFHRLLSWSIRPRWRYKAPQRNAMLRGILDFSRRRFGRVDIGSGI
jgi:GT2 family glycosyltransferase